MPEFAADAISVSYDYVIAGGGSAGCVLANRLSADSSLSVCLIEAGPPDTSPLISIPVGMAALYTHAKLNWRFSTIRQAALGDRQIYIPRGKVLGGSSAINGMVYMRGHRHDYDAWADAGNEGWGYGDVLPYFLRSENNEVWRDSAYHGIGGPMNVADLRTKNPVANAFIAAAQSVGLPFCSDFNGPDPVGVGFRQVTQKNGRRETSATAFLTPVRGRNNLTVVSGALVDRLVLEGTRATGILVRHGQGQEIIRAKREVILAAGAIGSPAILQRSGIGAREDLEPIGIQVIKELRGVGRNLQDHPSVGISHATDSAEPYGISFRAMPSLAWSLIDYALFRKGLLSSNVLEAAAYVKSTPTMATPDIQLSLMSARRAAGARNNSPSIRFGWGHGYSLTAIVLRPQSRGIVKVVDADPAQDPVIDPRFLADADVEGLLNGVKLARKILAAPAFAKYRSAELKPGRDIVDDDSIRRYIKSGSGVAFHPVGTCAMGVGLDAVVDAALRVHGLQCLRVVDASVMPTIISGNTNAPTVMIAEKAADMILGQAPLPAAQLETHDV